MNIHVPLRSILLATNLADIKWLFPFACSLAEESGAGITLVYVLTTIHGMTVNQEGLPYYGPEQAIAAAKAKLQDFCTGASCALNLRYDISVIEGTPAVGILAAADKVQADLLIMGTRARKGIEKWLLGSVAETVLHSAAIPVITVGPSARKAASLGRPIKSILFATSLKGKSNDAAALVYRWVERLHARLVLLHVTSAKHKDKLAEETTFRVRAAELRSLLPKDVFHEDLVEAQVRSGIASREILAAGTHVDLIALGTERTPLLARFAPEGTLYQVLAEAQCPVATLRSEHPGKRPV